MPSSDLSAVVEVLRDVQTVVVDLVVPVQQAICKNKLVTHRYKQTNRQTENRVRTNNFIEELAKVCGIARTGFAVSSTKVCTIFCKFRVL